MSTQKESANESFRGGSNLEAASPRRPGAQPTTVTVILKQQRPVTVEAVREGLSVDAVEKLAEQIQVTSAALQRYLKLSRQT